MNGTKMFIQLFVLVTLLGAILYFNFKDPRDSFIIPVLLALAIYALFAFINYVLSVEEAIKLKVKHACSRLDPYSLCTKENNKR